MGRPKSAFSGMFGTVRSPEINQVRGTGHFATKNTVNSSLLDHSLSSVHQTIVLLQVFQTLCLMYYDSFRPSIKIIIYC